jgi:malate synthase
MTFADTVPAPSPTYLTPERVRITGSFSPEYAEILTPSALAFVAELHRRFDHTRQALLARRAERQADFAAGICPISCLRPSGFASRPGRWRRCRKTCWTAGWKSPARWNGR